MQDFIQLLYQKEKVFMKLIKEYLEFIIIIYLVFSLVAFLIRMLEGDCKYRYMNYLLPLSIIHCEIK